MSLTFALIGAWKKADFRET